MRSLKRKVSCTFKREIPLEIQERIYLLHPELRHVCATRVSLAADGRIRI